jgi:hypothetical protein
MWYGQDGLPYKLVEMEQSHRINVVGFLRRRAASLQVHSWRLEAHYMRNAPDDVVDSWSREIPNSPEEWIEERPLMIELNRLIKLYDSIRPEQRQITVGPDRTATVTQRAVFS